MGVRRWAADVGSWLAGEGAFSYQQSADSYQQEARGATGAGKMPAIPGVRGGGKMLAVPGATGADKQRQRAPAVPVGTVALREGDELAAYGIGGGGTEEDYYWGRAAGAAGTEEDYYWRRLSDNWYQKDVLPSTYLEIHNACYEAYNANPLANYIIEITTNFVLGNGIKVTAASRRVQRVIDQFWRDPDNHMDTRVYALCTELSLYGEQFIRFFVNPYDGGVKIAQIDPSPIDEVETDPENVERVTRVHVRPSGSSRQKSVDSSQKGTGRHGSPHGERPTDYRLLSTDDSEGVWLSCPDEVVQVTVNKVSNAKRGKSDLATLLPWLRRYKDWLTDRVRINKYKGAFLWTIKLQGADRKTIDRKRMEYAYPPEPGSIVVHNESEEWGAVQPHIDADNVAADGRAIKLMIAMGAGLPEHYLSEGGEVNYATASEMGLPTFRKFQRRQDQFALLIRAIIDCIIIEAVRAGTLPAGVDRAYEVTMPELAPDDNAQAAQAAATMATALTTARAQGWVSDETAMRLLYASANAPVDVAEERARIARERSAALTPNPNVGA